MIFIDHADGHIKKASYEALTYGADVAKQLGVSAEGILLGTLNDDLASLGKYGVSKINQVNNEALNNLDAQVYAKVIEETVKSTGAKVLVFSHNQTGKAVAPRVAAGLKAGIVAGAVALPDTSNGFVVKKSVFSGKAFANVSIASDIKVISLNPNSYKTIAGEGSAEVNQLNVSVPASKVKITGRLSPPFIYQNTCDRPW